MNVGLFGGTNVQLDRDSDGDATFLDEKTMKSITVKGTRFVTVLVPYFHV
jgi:hypothetical protein